MEPLDYLNAIRRRWHLPAILVVVAVVAVLLTSDATPASDVRYRASTTLVPTSGDEDEASATIGRLPYLIVNGGVLERAAAELPYDVDAEDLNRVLQVEADGKLGLLRLTVIHSNADYAVRVADAVALATISVLDERAQENFQRRIEKITMTLQQAQQRINELDARLAQMPENAPGRSVVLAERDVELNRYRVDFEQLQLMAEAGGGRAEVDIFHTATAVPDSNTGFAPPKSRLGRLVLAVSLALLLGIAVALLADRLDTRLRDRSDFEEAYGAPVLAEVPAVARRGRRGFFPALQPKRRLSLHREAHRSLRTQLQLGMQGADEGTPAPGTSGKRSVIVVTSALPNEGKSTTVASLAASFAETGRSVLVLSADFRRPTIHEHLGVSGDGPGLTDVLAGRVPLAECVVSTAIQNVRLVPRGTRASHTQTLLDNGVTLLEQARELADVVIVDTAPVLMSSETAQIAVQADQVVVVAWSRKTRRSSAVRCAELLRTLTDITGVVVIGTPADAAGRYAYYYDGDLEEPEAVKANGHAGAPAAPKPSTGPVTASRPLAAATATTTTATYARTDGLTVERTGDGKVLARRQGANPVEISPDAAEVLELLEAPRSHDDLVAEVVWRRDVPPSRARELADGAVGQLLDRGLIRRT